MVPVASLMIVLIAFVAFPVVMLIALVMVFVAFVVMMLVAFVVVALMALLVVVLVACGFCIIVRIFVMFAVALIAVQSEFNNHFVSDILCLYAYVAALCADSCYA